MYKTLCTVGAQAPNEPLVELPAERIKQLLELGAIVKVTAPKNEAVEDKSSKQKNKE